MTDMTSTPIPTPELNQPTIEHQEQAQAPQAQETQPDTFGTQYMKQLDQRFTTLDPNQRDNIQAWLRDIDTFSQDLTAKQTNIVQAGMNILLANEPTRSSAEHMAKAIEKIMTDLMNSNELVYTDGDYFRLIV